MRFYSHSWRMLILSTCSRNSSLRDTRKYGSFTRVKDANRFAETTTITDDSPEIGFNLEALSFL